MNISEAARETPVIAECDLCVLGGSCTGLFAAIRAARLGLSVAIVERMGCSEAEGFTRAEIEGRRQVRAILDIVNQNVPGAKLGLLALPARIGIRQTRHARCSQKSDLRRNTRSGPHPWHSRGGWLDYSINENLYSPSYSPST